MSATGGNEPPTPASPPPQRARQLRFIRPITTITDFATRDIELRREIVRGKLALRLMWIFGGTIAVVFALAGGGWLKLTDSLPVLTAVVGVIGTVLGFYFGGHGDQPRR